jgi:nicotinamidase-related amidase
MFTIPGPVILDLNTQRDLFASDGAYPVFQADKFADPLKKLFVFAHRNAVPVISTRFNTLQTPGQRDGALAMMAGNRGNGSAATRLICQPNTPGYQKMPFTNLRRRREWPLDCGTDIPVDGFRTLQQFVFDLPNLNLFESPRLDRLLSEATAEVFLIAGAPLEWSVRTAVLGLLARRHKVAVVSDCLAMWDPYEGDMALRQVESKNVEWFTVDQVTEKYNAAARQRASRAERAAARAKARMAPPVPVTMAMKQKADRPADRPPQRGGRGAFRV